MSANCSEQRVENAEGVNIQAHCPQISYSTLSQYLRTNPGDIRALIVYGGEADKRRSLDSFEVLYVDDWKWKKLLPKNNIPPAREFHTFTPISNGDFLIFGGLTLPYSHYLNDLWVLKGLDQLKDTKTVELYGGNCVQVKTKGTPPSGRYAHKAHYHK